MFHKISLSMFIDPQRVEIPLDDPKAASDFSAFMVPEEESDETAQGTDIAEEISAEIALPAGFVPITANDQWFPIQTGDPRHEAPLEPGERVAARSVFLQAYEIPENGENSKNGERSEASIPDLDVPTAPPRVPSSGDVAKLVAQAEPPNGLFPADSTAELIVAGRTILASNAGQITDSVPEAISTSHSVINIQKDPGENVRLLETPASPRDPPFTSPGNARDEIYAKPGVTSADNPTRQPTLVDSVWVTREKLDLPDLLSTEATVDAPVTSGNNAEFSNAERHPELQTRVPNLTAFPPIQETDPFLDLSATPLQPVEKIGLRFDYVSVAPSIQPPVPRTAQALPALATQLAQHTTAAKSGGVDVLLSPEELGKVRFEIVQTNDMIRIMLSAERPETMDLFRRHSEQLLQEFRQSGFTGTSLSFGQWSQQEKPEQSRHVYAQADLIPTEGLTPDTLIPVTPIYIEGQGLNLRL